MEILSPLKRKSSSLRTTRTSSVVFCAWMDKKKALIALGYFEFFSEDQILVASKLSTIRRFEPLDTIYKQDRGQLSNVHFILSGECMILQCLKMEMHEHAGKSVLRLVELPRDNLDAKAEETSEVETMPLLKQINTKNHKTSSAVNRLVKSDESLHEKDPEQGARQSSTSAKHEEILPLQPMETKSFSFGWMPSSEVSLRFDRIEESHNKQLDQENFDEGSAKVPEDIENHENPCGKPEEESKLSAYFKGGVYATQETIKVKPSPTSGSHLHQKKRVQRKGTSVRIVNRFIDVGTYNKFGIFGLGEQLEDRAIIARTPVLCLVVPRYWLLQKEQNPGNIWNRRRFTLNAAIPSRQNLFNIYLQNTRWDKYKKNYIKSLVDTTSSLNSTKTEDIPILCRILEGQTV